MTTDNVLDELARAYARACELAKENGEDTLSGSYDAGRASGLAEAVAIIARLTEVTK